MTDPFTVISELVRKLKQEQAEKGFQFLLIGGYGLEAHAVQRDTRDIDFAIVTESVPQAEKILFSLGYERTDLNNLCGRYDHPFGPVIPVDLLLVNQSTMEKLLHDSVTHEFLGHDVRAPSLASFIALKLHAIKWNAKRFGKDASDIVRLMEQNPTTVSMEKLQELCDQFGPPGVFEKLRILLGTMTTDLELPIITSPPHLVPLVSTEEALRWRLARHANSKPLPREAPQGKPFVWDEPSQGPKEFQ